MKPSARNNQKANPADSAGTKRLKVGDVAKMFNTTPRTLRFYEEEGLLRAGRTDKGTRLYSQHDIARLEVVLLLGSLGTPLQAILELALARSTSATGDEASHKVSGLLKRLREETEEKKAQLAVLEREIAHADTLARQCFGCKRRPTRETCQSCGSVEPLDQAMLFNLILEQDRSGSM
jgi:DNA-binding transcriptional MerR regulator